MIASIPAEHPLEVVIHAAGVLDDGVLGALDGERLRGVLAPKVQGAINLHELTRDLELSAFVLFSSAAATIGSPGQANYAAANAFLDAFAYYRRAQGLPALSLAWGIWEQSAGMAGVFGEADHSRWARAGVTPLSDERGLELLDFARTVDEPLLLPVCFDMAALRAGARAGVLPALASGLVRSPARRAAGSEGSLARRLASAPEPDRDTLVLELVAEQVAGVLGHSSAGAIDVTRDFKELGLDSLGAVELRNRLSQATGLKLPATLGFDHPTPAAVAAYLCSKVSGAERRSPVASRSPARADDPIVIVGMSCRYPGGVSSPQELWELVASGADAIGPLPEDRGWDLERLFHPDPDHPGTSYSRHGGFLYDAAEFDPEFFSISPREALAMDPQQRLLLEGAWDAFEHGGIDPAALRGSQTGVFTGVISSDYGFGENQPEQLQAYRLTGSTASVASGRVAYTFGLEGPAVSVDTACSSSLVAIHMACQALRSGECELALAGGVTVLGTPGALIVVSRGRGLSPDGRCKSFGADADGTGWAEGVGLVLLERLSDARRNAHRVLAVVRGSAVNQDGASNGLTAPNGPSQERVIRQALASAGLAASDIDTVEAHGTGTVLGDPIEAQALFATYGQMRPGDPLWLGSLKSNIGHTQAAAGVAGVIKMVKAMEHQLLPRTLHAERPSPHINWSEGEVSLLGEPVSWPRSERVRRAGVSSFGISGTNAHVILEEPPEPVQASEPERAPGLESAPESEGNLEAAAPADETPAERTMLPFLLSAKRPAALRAQAARVRSHLAAHPELPLARVASTLALHRASLEHRAVVVAGDASGLSSALLALERSEPATGLIQGAARRRERLAFVFPGQGGQWEGMALELWESSPLFAERMQVCAEALAAYCDWSLEDVLRGRSPDANLEQGDVLQPVLFAVMVSLAALWRSFGVEPSAVVGHSQGEIAAAHVAGGLSLDDAARIVALRSRAQTDELRRRAISNKPEERGGMISVLLGAETVETHIQPYGERLSLAVVNGPSAVVVSGELEPLEELAARYRAEGVRVREILAGGAGHSAQVESVRERVIEELAPVRPRSSEIPFYSTTTGGVLDTAELSAEYWFRNMRHTVQFEQATRALIADSFTAFVEVSPHPVLAMAVQATIDARTEDPDAVVVVGSLRRGEGSMTRFLSSLSEAHVRGVAVDWSRLLGDGGENLVELPTYAFQRERYWHTAWGGAGDARTLGQSAAEHPLLGAALHLAEQDGGFIFTGRLSIERHPWIRDHASMDTVLLPGTAFIELALAAAERAGAGAIEELTFERPLIVDGEGMCQLQLTISGPDSCGSQRINIYSRPEHPAEEGPEPGEWTRHAAGVLAPSGERAPQGGGGPPSGDLGGLADGSWPVEDLEELEVERLYDRLAEAGYSYGPAFQGLRRAWRAGADEIYAEIALAEEQAFEASGFCIHPALLDAALHALAFVAPESQRGEELQIPFSVSGVRLHARGAAALRVRLRADADGAASLLACDPSGVPVLAVDSLIRRPIDPSQLEVARSIGHDALYGLQWVELPAPSPGGSTPVVALLGDGGDLAVAGVGLERHVDLGALEEAIAGGAT
ncbi:MAG TPA: beta-ketoacyl synthase N-terminal-like domain-containing protein, partial [Solirubrobacteraceae bacterium]|nr:beta-ketoacyl synthase N-terminal-like domain-containing protein [Solirubrobacteraceae bacterium]